MAQRTHHGPTPTSAPRAPRRSLYRFQSQLPAKLNNGVAPKCVGAVVSCEVQGTLNRACLRCWCGSRRYRFTLASLHTVFREEGPKAMYVSAATLKNRRVPQPRLQLEAHALHEPLPPPPPCAQVQGVCAQGHPNGHRRWCVYGSVRGGMLRHGSAPGVANPVGRKRLQRIVRCTCQVSTHSLSA